VFHHVPKTGGTTVRLGLENRFPGKVKYIFVSGRGLFEEAIPKLEVYFRMKARKKPILFLEVHGRDSPNLIEMEPFLRKWKGQAETAGIPTFFFSILREPWSHAISYFNFFYVQRKNPYFTLVDPTEDNFLIHALYNPQCQFLARGEFSLRNKTKQEVTLEECQRVQDTLLNIMDWVGTTASLSMETLPILCHILKVKQNIFQPEMVSNKTSNVAISKSQLGDQTISAVNEMLLLDKNMYTNIQQYFGISMWNDFAEKNT
jgi:hypothetical protein